MGQPIMGNCQVFEYFPPTNWSLEDSNFIEPQLLSETEMLQFGVWCICFSIHVALQIVYSYRQIVFLEP